MMHRGDNGNGSLCHACGVPSEVARLAHKVLVIERDAVAGLAGLREVEARLVEIARVLGDEVARLGGLVSQAGGSFDDQ
jgi:hypothetical protein